jgi:hypothetical protein
MYQFYIGNMILILQPYTYKCNGIDWSYLYIHGAFGTWTLVFVLEAFPSR